MKRILPLLIVILASAAQLFAQRFTNQVFSNVSVTSNVTYGTNISVLTGTPTSIPLNMDVYQPVGDSCINRPVIIYLHAGTVLPIIYNVACVGTKSDSSIVELCTQWAKRGYVAIAMDYRLGWRADAIGVDNDETVGTLFMAIYRAIQDAKACVRYVRANATTYGIDTNRVVLGGVGTGSIIAANYVALRDTNQLWLDKFLSSTNNATYGFVIGQPYVNIHLLGDFDGYGGIPQLNNPNNSPGHSNDVQMLFTIYGELGDSSWIKPYFPPTVAFHPMTPPPGGGPYHFGPINAGNTGIPVLPDVSGSHQYICKFDANHVNDVFINANYSDVFTTRANSINTACEGLFPFETVGQQEDLWDWYDLPTMEYVASTLPGQTAADGDTAYYSSLANNPNMSKTQALHYIDTIQGYLSPRLYTALNLSVWSCTLSGVNEIDNISDYVSVYPNPAAGNFTISLSLPAAKATVELTDVSGRVVKHFVPTSNTILVDRKNLADGMYYVKVKTDQGEAVKKIILQ
jgi:hypothetical protein